MPRTRAYRRHKRHVKLARRNRILSYAYANSWIDHYRGPADPRDMNAHIRCNCWDDPRAHAIERRRQERAWRELERRASGISCEERGDPLHLVGRLPISELSRARSALRGPAPSPSRDGDQEKPNDITATSDSRPHM